MRVLGLDPGTHTTGYGAVERTGSRLRHLDNGLIVAKRAAPLEERLLHIADRLDAIMAELNPAVVAIEDIFFSKNAQSALILGHARGVALLAAARHGVAVISYSPALVKKTVSGSGRAEKGQIQQMVRVLLGLPEVPAEDAADALALAITHCHHDHTPAVKAALG